MFPGMDKRSMEAAMRKLGVQQQNVDAEEVVIRLKGSGKEIVIANPSVTKVSMMGQETFQIAGEFNERHNSAASGMCNRTHSDLPQQSLQQQQLFSDEDVKTVVAQADVSDVEAKAALAKVNGDLAAAILLLGETKG